MTIAVLALQGAFLEHEKMLNKLNINYFEIRKKEDLEKSFDALIIPGGESTTQGKLLKDLGMFDLIKTKIENGLPVFGTCAGLILLAKEIENEKTSHLATMDIVVKRNAYGKQTGSFYFEGKFNNIENIPMTFIRAPYITKVSDNVEILVIVDGKIVAARQGNQLVTAFHPELNDDLTVHKYFINMIKNK